MNGFNIAEAGHVVNLLPAVSISGGKTAQAFSMKDAEHVSIIISFGAMGALVPTSIVVNQCTSAAGANATALPTFRYYYQALGGAGNDNLNGGSPPNWAPVGGITTFPTTVANVIYVIEIDAAELDGISAVVGPITEYPYIQVVIADSGNVTITSAIAVLSGLRYAGKSAQPLATI